MNNRYKIELHVHTKYSHDSILPFWLLYLKCRICKIDYIAITEHNNIAGAKAFKKYCEQRGNKVNVIIGEEIMTNSGEIIGLFLKENIPSGLSPENTINNILKQGGIVYIPHPYDKKREKTVLLERYISENKEKIHCMEIYNGRNISNEYGRKQEQLAQKYNINGVIGADAHTFFEIGRNYMLVNIRPNSAINFLKAIENKNIKMSKCLNFCHYITKIDKMINFIRKGDIDGFCRIINKKFRKFM